MRICIQKRYFWNVFSFVLVAVISLTGAQCQPTPHHRKTVATQHSGPSSSIIPVLGSGFSNWHNNPSTNKPWYPYGTYGTKIITDDIIDHRISQNLSLLKWHPGLAAVAHVHALEMAKAHQLFMVDPLTGADVYERLVDSSPAIQFDDAHALIRRGPVGDYGEALGDFLANPSAKASIEYPPWTHIGVGWAAKDFFPNDPDRKVLDIFQVVIFARNVR